MNYPEPHQLLKWVLRGILFIVILNGIIFFIWNMDIVQLMPKQSVCPIKMATGKECPGCGMTRAFLKIGQLHFRDAFYLNPFSYVIMMVILLYLFNPRLLNRLNTPFNVSVLLVAALILWAYRIFS